MLVESLKAMLIAVVSCVGVMALSAVYVISPIDLIPDLIPVLGWMDDAGVVMLAVTILELSLLVALSDFPDSNVMPLVHLLAR